MNESAPENEKPMDADSDFSLEDETSTKPYNEPKARKEFGDAFIDELSENQKNRFKGDWWQLAKLIKNIEDDKQKPDIKPEDRLAEWKQWRNEVEEQDHFEYIHLESAILYDARLANTDFNNAHLENANLSRVRLENAKLYYAHLEKAKLSYAHLEHADLSDAHFEKANLRFAHLDAADLSDAHMEDADLNSACLKDANFSDAHLEKADLFRAHLENATLSYAHFENADFSNCYLKEISFQKCYMAGAYFYPNLDDIESVDFRGIDLNNINMEDSLKAQIKYQNRKRNWHEWYKKHPFARWPVRMFWLTSDYGYSTRWIISSFVILSFIFAALYFFWPDGLNGLNTNKDGDSFIHALYFSVVTMTTLGFGDIHAKSGYQGTQILVMLQVLLGYILLGVLISHLATLQQLDGPPGDYKKKISLKEYLPKLWKKLKKWYPTTMPKVEHHISEFQRRLRQ